MKPTPKVVSTICTVCDEPWEDHGDKPTVADCIRLLKRHRLGVTIYPQPRPWYPGWQWGNVWSTMTINQTSNAAPIERPDVYEVATQRLES